MAQITAEMQRTAQVAPAQVGNGQAVHYVSTAQFTADTQCSRTVARVLNERDAKGAECTRCVKKVQALLAAQAPAAPVEEPAAPAAVEPPARIKALTEDVTTPATMFDPELTYYADGTPVVMRWTGGEKPGTTAGMTVDRGPYAFQAVTFEDGTTSNVAPHVLHRIDPPAPAAPRYLADYVTVLDGEERVQRLTVTVEGDPAPVLAEELPYEPERNAARALEALGWTITGMETYGGPSLFRAWVEPCPVPAAPLLMPDQARGIVNQVHADANDFRTAEDANGRLLGYTFRSTTTPATRYGYITHDGTFSMALEPTREDAAAMLPAAVLSDERHAQRPSPAAQRAAALAAQRETATAARAAHRAEMDDRSAAEAHRHGASLPPATADRIAERMAEPEQPGPFKPGDLIVCADGKVRTVSSMAPEFAGEPLRVIVEGGAQWLAAECEHARELELHAPHGYTGPRALCGYADHLAPARLDGTLDVHERTPGTMGHCPGSLLTPRAHREELTRRHTTAFSYNPPRPTFLACTAKPGDVVEHEEQEHTVQDCHPSDVRHVLVTFTDDTAATFTLEDRLTYRRRVRARDVRCQECGVTATEDTDEAADGTPSHRLCGVCDHPDATDPEHRAAVLEEAVARLTTRAAYAHAHAFQPVVADDRARPVGWTFRTGYGAQAAYGWVTALGRLIAQVGTEYRWQSERAVLDHHEAGTLAPTSHDLVPALAARPVAEIRKGLEALRGSDEAPAENAPARRVVEGVIVQHDGATEGCVPRDVTHPDVLAARRALAGLAAARLTDHHDVSEPTEEEQQVRGYMVNPRGQGRVAVYWLEGGQIIRRDTPLHGAALDCLEDRMRRQGWETERMGRSAQCLFAHVPEEQRQG
ncbi:hypothetical protein J7E96_28410 [Streptomyces sp. ISL-96]|uniref:hypothetical protein n=1 Tax=Streptomyces sp. ISL-96 TaxID=2819191 RepID=UPI001BE5BACE|nr:hypothetical protein [Streptomyces sp. ISL-96]MBT2492364.1 hypothetical protein [Streptomyces sp. ISL-96]